MSMMIRDGGLEGEVRLVVISYGGKERCGLYEVFFFLTCVVVKDLETTGCTEEKGECGDISMSHHGSPAIIRRLILLA